MKTSEINWNVVEEIAMTVFPDEYEMLSPDQVKDLEERISEGQPITPDEDAGGVNNNFADPIQLVNTILQVLALLEVWYIYKHPKNQNTNYKDFHDYQKNNHEVLINTDDEIIKRVCRVIEKNFKTIKDKFDDFRNKLKA